jgi:hypothetical protein
MSNIKALPFKFDIEKIKEALNFIINNYGDYFYELSWGIEDNILRSINLMGVKGHKGRGVHQEKIRRIIQKESDYLENGIFTKSFNRSKNTYINEILNTLSSMYTIGRIMIYKIGPNSILPKHIDSHPRILLPIITNTNCTTFLYNDDETIKLELNLLADGSAYLFNATSVLHSVSNFDKVNTGYRMVFDVIDYKPGAIKLNGSNRRKV